ncbi:MAG: hypothetical protein PHQ58_10925 [Rhodoferax sp.]|uniref:hypothetical protein n=1 Tax=Rhodoferax sp. TaxID=50421 RepID=UPI00262503AE|nr:hypothetical protein [Rhodoferax sp.]MDD2880944.1 hypothetical protein [Rhodoferax sp.]
MNPQSLDSQLSKFEAQLALLSAALIRNDANELVATSAELQSMAVMFSRVLQQTAASLRHNPAAMLRVKKIHAALGSIREGLLRQRVQVDRSLAALVPASQNNTYSPSAGGYGRQPYGSAGRQSGEFRALSA